MSETTILKEKSLSLILLWMVDAEYKSMVPRDSVQRSRRIKWYDRIPQNSQENVTQILMTQWIHYWKITIVANILVYKSNKSKIIIQKHVNIHSWEVVEKSIANYISRHPVQKVVQNVILGLCANLSTRWYNFQWNWWT